MFDRVAKRYDLTNTVLSGGRDAAWRRATREALGARPGQTVLDVAAGTAVSTVELAAGGVTRDRLRLLPGDAAGRRVAAGAQGGRRRDGAAAGRRERRRRRHLLRPAQRGRPRRGAARVPAGHPARRDAGDLRVLQPHLDAVPHRLHRVPDEGAAADRPRGEQQPRGLRLPRRVDPRVARPGRRSPAGCRTPAGATWPGTTSPAASSRCTAPAASERRRDRRSRPGSRSSGGSCGSTC